MTIAFVHNNKAFLPGLYGYRQFFTRYGIQCEVVTPDELGTLHRNVEWHFLGTDITKPREGIYKIHEYPSSSLPPFRKWKDWVKSFMNTQPDFRIFQNEFVKQSLNFHDSIPFGYRELGIPEEWLKNNHPLQKEYDFIYTGDVSASRKIKELINLFTTSLKDHSLLILSNRYEELQSQTLSHRNIIFKGPVKKDRVREYLLKSKFAINYIPDMVPFNRQTSTKLLEYIACKIPVITSRYEWMNEFAQLNGGSYFFLNKDMTNFTWEAVNNFSYSFPDLSDWTWEKQIRKSGVLEFLMATFPELKF
jgi:glycosyltransferase involved in cell wall biosynthesis